MRRTLTTDNKRHTYDTDTAKQIAHRSFGNFGDPAGYEETLYRTRNGLYFVYGIGGYDSPWPSDGDIRKATEEDAKTWTE